MIDEIDEYGMIRMNKKGVATLAFIVAILAGMIEFILSRNIVLFVAVVATIAFLVYTGFMFFYGMLCYYEEEEKKIFERYHRPR